MIIKVDIPNSAVELVKSMGNATGWCPTSSFTALSRNKAVTQEAITHVNKCANEKTVPIELNVGVDVAETINQMATAHDLTVSSMVAVMIIQCIMDKIADEKKETH